MYTAYCPELDVASCGRDIAEAQNERLHLSIEKAFEKPDPNTEIPAAEELQQASFGGRDKP